MKLFDENMQVAKIGNFAFSGVRPDKLGSTEYTLVTLVMDITGSVSSFARELLDSKLAVVGACKKNPRAEFLLLRNTEFNDSVTEVHGFAELASIDPSMYKESVCRGITGLYDATYDALAATNEYAKTLTDAEFSVNATVFVITDGDDNCSIQTQAAVASEIKRGVQNEWLESLNVVLIGVNAKQYGPKLQQFVQKAGLTQYVDAGDATPSRLAQLADFVSRSISSQSQALGTGGPSQALTF